MQREFKEGVGGFSAAEEASVSLVVPPPSSPRESQKPLGEMLKQNYCFYFRPRLDLSGFHLDLRIEQDGRYNPK